MMTTMPETYPYVGEPCAVCQGMHGPLDCAARAQIDIAELNDLDTAELDDARRAVRDMIPEWAQDYMMP